MGFSDFAKVSTNPRLARAVAIASACFAFGSACASRAASSARTVELSGADTGKSSVTVIVCTIHPLDYAPSTDVVLVTPARAVQHGTRPKDLLVGH